MSRAAIGIAGAVVAVVLALASAAAAADFGFLGRYDGTRGSGPGQFEVGDEAPPLAVDSAGFVYAVDEPNGRIEKFTPDLRYAGSFGSLSTGVAGPGQFVTAAKVAVGPGDVIYVLDTNRYHAVQKFDTSGNFLGDMVLNAAPYDGRPAEVDRPHGFAVDRAGNVFVLDGRNGRVVRFDSNGTRVGSFGSFGFGDGQFAPYAPIGVPVGGPEAMAADANGNLFVVDTYGDRVEKFTGTGQFLASWGTRGEGDGQFESPKDIAIGPDGTVWVSEFDRVQHFSSDGRFLGRFGVRHSFENPNDTAILDGEFWFLNGIATDSRGDLYAADQPIIGTNLGARIQKFGPGGVRPPGTELPSGPTVTIGLTLTHAPTRGLCPVRLDPSDPPWQDCSTFRTANVKWSITCPDNEGKAGWAVALRGTPGAADANGNFSYQPLKWTGPEFPSGAPTRTSSGTWQLPDGTDIGVVDPRKTNVLSYAGGLTGPATGHRNVFVQPGERLYSTAIGVCSYHVSSGKVETIETSGNSAVRIVEPAIAVRTLSDLRGKRLRPRNLKHRKPFLVDLMMAYDDRALRHGTVLVRFYARGAGVNQTQKTDGLLTIRPERRGTITLWGTVNGERTANTVRLKVR